jgi:D-alanyl-D-alanine carboxypeptidase
MINCSALEKVSHIPPFKYFQYFYNSLPIAGIDVTLRRRIRLSTVGDNIKATRGSVIIVFPIQI